MRLSDTYNGVDSLSILLPDWARYRCWKAKRMCEAWLDAMGHTRDRGARPGGSRLERIEAHVATKGQAHAAGTGATIEAVAVARARLERAWLALPYSSDREGLAAVLRASIASLRALRAAAGTARAASLPPVPLRPEAVIAVIEAAVQDVLTLREPTMVYY